MLSWSCRDNKPLKIPSDSISESLIFLGGMPPDPLDLACFVCQIVYFALNYHAHSNIIVPPPFSESWIRPCKILLNFHFQNSIDYRDIFRITIIANCDGKYLLLPNSITYSHEKPALKIHKVYHILLCVYKHPF